uniref:Peptidase S1 domain-containing protein n=1 Tax=Haemonchus contortus TaxID=6289 RepID=A0A7I4YG75_HAECO
TFNMERLLFAFVLIGTTLACQPVPPPEKSGRGHDTAYVTIVTDQPYNPSKIKQYLGYFPKTKIKQYSRRLGDFSNLDSTDVDGNFAFTFTIKHCVCAYVKQWVNQIVESSEHYISGNAVCVKPESPVMVETTTTARTTTRTTTTASSLIALEPAPPPAFVGRGHDTAYVTIVTDQPYNPSKVNQHIGYFPKTKMEQHAWQLGDFSNLELTNVGGYSAYTFILKQCICGYVKKWVNQIVQSSQHYTSGDAVCFYEESSSFVRERTTTTTASSSIALPPAPPPAFVGRGDDTAYVAIVTDQPYDPSKVNQYMDYFPKTKMEQYAWQLGDFSNLGVTNIGGNFAYTFTIPRSVCGYVKRWANQIVQSSQHYTSGDAVCLSEESSLGREKTAAATTTTTSSPILSPFAAHSPPRDLYNEDMFSPSQVSLPIGTTAALQPVPPPPFHGRGRDTAQVTLVTNQPYDPAKVKQHMDYFPQTKIQQYANELGDFSNLGYADVNDNFAYTFTLSRSACEYVNLWVNRIVRSSPYYTNGNTRCSNEGSSFVREKTATTTTKTTASSPILSPSDISYLLNMPECEKD